MYVKCQLVDPLLKQLNFYSAFTLKGSSVACVPRCFFSSTARRKHEITHMLLNFFTFCIRNTRPPGSPFALDHPVRYRYIYNYTNKLLEILTFMFLTFNVPIFFARNSSVDIRSFVAFYTSLCNYSQLLDVGPRGAEIIGSYGIFR